MRRLELEPVADVKAVGDASAVVEAETDNPVCELELDTESVAVLHPLTDMELVANAVGDSADNVPTRVPEYDDDHEVDRVLVDVRVPDPDPDLER